MNIEKEMLALIQIACNEKTQCIIDLASLPISTWDEAYVFSNVDKDSIQKTIKAPYSLYEDIGVKIIFLSNKKIVNYQELFPYPDSKDTKNKILFSFNGDKSPGIKAVDYFYFDLNHAKLQIKKQQYSNDGINQIVVYNLYPAHLPQPIEKN